MSVATSSDPAHGVRPEGTYPQNRLASGSLKKAVHSRSARQGK